MSLPFFSGNNCQSNSLKKRRSLLTTLAHLLRGKEVRIFWIHSAGWFSYSLPSPGWGQGFSPLTWKSRVLLTEGSSYRWKLRKRRLKAVEPSAQITLWDCGGPSQSLSMLWSFTQSHTLRITGRDAIRSKPFILYIRKQRPRKFRSFQWSSPTGQVNLRVRAQGSWSLGNWPLPQLLWNESMQLGWLQTFGSSIWLSCAMKSSWKGGGFSQILTHSLKQLLYLNSVIKAVKHLNKSLGLKLVYSNRMVKIWNMLLWQIFIAFVVIF